MSYRLDEGHGACLYRLGVEDDGCHSLLDYSSIAESARVLECIARNLNAVVLERKMIQNEVLLEKGTPVPSGMEPIVVYEEPILCNGMEHLAIYEEDSLNKEEKNPDDVRLRGLRTEDGVYTRCELTIQRVETHLLDPSPMSVAALALATAGNANSLPKKGNESSPTKKPDATTKSDHLSISETLSSRNIRVAVVGNVDAGKSTLIGTLTTFYLRARGALTSEQSDLKPNLPQSVLTPTSTLPSG
jgi:hypothetical protein